MPDTDKEPTAERQQTDESLRAEREKADQGLVQELAAVDESADAVLERARTRADEVLAVARAKSDSKAPPASGAQVSVAIARERVSEDHIVREERAHADEVVRVERAAQATHLMDEREATDKDLFRERARSDVALATRDEFLGVVSHDLLNLLNSMVLSAALIAESVVGDNHVEHVLKQAQRIRGAGARMSRLIGDLVDVASIEGGALAVTREVLDPTAIVAEAVNTCQVQGAAREVVLVAELVPPLALAAFDPARILQVLSNLLGNAIKFTPAGGKVVLRVERLGAELRFAVSDSGIGIDADKLEVIFERFVQVIKNDRRGSGLGLYISKCIVQGHGGRIWAESKLGEGSTFYFTLPVAA